MNAAKLPNEAYKISEDDYSDTNKYLLLEPYENQKYSIKINKIETGILIQATQVHNSNRLYKIELGLNDFYHLSKGFRMFDNLEEICDALQNIFISNKASIIKKDYTILIILIINLIGGKEQEINIELNSIRINKVRSDNTIFEINELRNEINKINEEKNFLFKKIGDLENIINLQNKEIEKLKGIIKE